jgi:hypothetical protein
MKWYSVLFLLVDNQLKMSRGNTPDSGNLGKLQNERERLAQIAVELYRQLETIVQERKIPSANFLSKYSGRMKGLLPIALPVLVQLIVYLNLHARPLLQKIYH